MKQTLNLIGLIALALILGSCTSDRLDGDWDDNIKLSTKTIRFDKSEKSATITTKGKGWWINGVSVNEKNYPISKDIDVSSDSYTVKSDCFTVEKKDQTTLSIKVDENNTRAERKIVIHLQAGNYFDRVTITQQGD